MLIQQYDFPVHNVFVCVSSGARWSVKSLRVCWHTCSERKVNSLNEHLLFKKTFQGAVLLKYKSGEVS